MGKALVSTTIGAEGLDVMHGRDLLLADDPSSFAQCVIQLLRDPELRRRYEQSAALQAQRHDWTRIAERFAGVLSETIAESRAGRKPDGATVMPGGS